MEISEMTHKELNEATAWANMLAESHATSCPYCRQKQCTKGRALCDRVVELENEQEMRADQADIEAERAAERRNEEFLDGGSFIAGA